MTPRERPEPGSGARTTDRSGRRSSSATRPSRTAGLLRACHPGPAVAVTAVAAALAAGAGRGAAGTAWVTLAVLLGQLSIGWSNDALDVGRDVRAGRPDKPLVTGALDVRAVRLAAGLAAAGCVPASFATGAASGAVHLVAVVSAWAYNLGLKRTTASFLPYAVSFGLLPAVATLGLPGRPWPPAWALLAGALLGVAAHAANVLPDIDDDLAEGVRGLPQRLGRRGALVMASAALVAGTLALVLGPDGPPDALGWAGLGGAAAVGAAASGRRRRVLSPFAAVVAVAVVDVSLLVARGTSLT